MNKIRIYGSEYCSYCHKAKELAESIGLEHSYIDIQEKGNENHLAFVQEQKHRTIPQIYEWDDAEQDYTRHVGGFTDLYNKVQENSKLAS